MTSIKGGVALEGTTVPQPRPISTQTGDASSAFDGPAGPPVDSGYGSASLTPKPLEKTAKPCSVDSGGGAGRVLFLPSGRGNLQEFNKPVDAATIARFKDVLERVEAPLLRHMKKRSVRREPMALRLMVLGQTEETAKVWIVVLCHETGAKRARKYFEQQHVKDVIRPEDSSIPSFDVLVVGQSPKTRGAAIDVCIRDPMDPPGPITTLCGAPIKLVNGDEYQLGTCGGLIKLTFHDGDYALYGMTARHLTNRWDGVHSLHLAASEDDSDRDSDHWDHEDEDEDEDLSDPDDPFETPQPPVLGPACGLDERPSPENHLSSSWHRVGQFIAPSAAQLPRNPQDYDWALIGFDDRHAFRPNSFGAFEGGHRQYRAGDFKVGVVDLMDSATFSVVMKSGVQGIQSGVMSSLPCRVWLGYGKEFVDVYTLNLENGAEIRDGDSGSWVLNPSRLEVYGHVIASDAFGSGYIIPMTRSLEDIRQTVDLASVELPTLVDVASKVFSEDFQGDDYADLAVVSSPPRTPKRPVEQDDFEPEEARDFKRRFWSPTSVDLSTVGPTAYLPQDSGYVSQLPSAPRSAEGTPLTARKPKAPMDSDGMRDQVPCDQASRVSDETKDTLLFVNDFKFMGGGLLPDSEDIMKEFERMPTWY
ncbi:hypothetical protein A1O7_01248 [Cladophialophora yegresii CBS 114405]|uniref:Uncharacterized protein n=1 Tax=Cladophialophora yegresii CBS 114405 TaxID=1182544 RepID=W9X350_9EURO|nr:uncharacterized protein A1O7_01248 [Cladophialophora yegresii CBS 114405]EXJ64909.1 hypothetical protein A1O7_01248 [Cladophialophora yegresii CBS 114405]